MGRNKSYLTGVQNEGGGSRPLLDNVQKKDAFFLDVFPNCGKEKEGGGDWLPFKVSDQDKSTGRKREINIARVAKSCPESWSDVKVLRCFFLLKDVIITTSVTTVIFITITI